MPINIDKFTMAVNAVVWQKYDEPKYFRYYADGINSFADIVPQSLIALASAEYVEPMMAGGYPVYPQVAGGVLDSIGNNHNGTYYPVVREALPFIMEVALNGNNKFSRGYAVNVLDDLYCFSPDMRVDVEGLQDFVRSTIEAKRVDLARIEMHEPDILVGLIEMITENELLKLSLDELEGEPNNEPKSQHERYVASVCCELRKIPIGKLTASELRPLIIYKQGLAHIMPLAIDMLCDPLHDGVNFKNGDGLLQAVLGTDARFWKQNPKLLRLLTSALMRLEENIEHYQKTVKPAWEKKLLDIQQGIGE